MTSLFCISSCLRIYLEQQSSCRISYRPPILTSLRQRIWPSLYLMLYQKSAQTLSGKKSNNKQRLCVQTQAQHILHARKGRPRKLDVCGGPDRENTDRQYWWHENALFLPSYRQVDGGNEKALFNRGKWCLKHTSFLDKQLLLPMARHYGVSEENLSAELYQVRRLLQRKEEQRHTIHSTKEFHSWMRPYKDAFMNLYTLICIALTLSVTSVSCDAVFLAWAV